MTHSLQTQDAGPVVDFRAAAVPASTIHIESSVTGEFGSATSATRQKLVSQRSAVTLHDAKPRKGSM